MALMFCLRRPGRRTTAFLVFTSALGFMIGAGALAISEKQAKPFKKIIQRPAAAKPAPAAPPRLSAPTPLPETPAPRQVSFATAPSRIPTVLDKLAPFRRCLWVSRWEYESEEDVIRICTNAASARFTDLFFQVRGAGTVCYPSAIEPWAPQVSPGGGNPGWDPLATAVREAHKYGLRVHAYMNALPAATKGETNGTLYKKHRSWLMVDSRGRQISPSGGYAFVDPGLPEVRQYLAAIFAEAASRYEVDGIHLDYIRYPEERGDYSYHPAVVADFKKIYKKEPWALPSQWANYRREQVTAAVREIAAAVRKARPGIEVSASVIAEREKSYERAFQSSVEWVGSGLLDAVAPMAYSYDLDRFETLCAPYRGESVRGKVWLGVWGVSKNTHFQDELRRAIADKFAGVSVFSYQNLFPSHKSSARARGTYETFMAKQPAIRLAEQ